MAMNTTNLKRRLFIKQTALALGGVALTTLGASQEGRSAPLPRSSRSQRPQAAWGIQIGDVTDRSAIIWSRADGPAQLLVEWSRDERFRHVRHVASAPALEET